MVVGMTDQRAGVVVFTLGGTIASTPEARGHGAAPTLSGEDLLEAVPGLDTVARVQAHSFRQYPSGDLEIADLLALAAEITTLAAGGIDGFVVTQGTDTLEESAYLLDLTVAVEAPVVVTGAMRHPGLPGADGPANLLAAVQVATSELARSLGTLVVLNEEIHAARYVRKTHTSSPATFQSPSLGPIGWVNENRVRIPLVPRRRTPVITLPDPMISTPAVALIRLGLGDDARSLEHLVEDGYAGVIIDAFGAGHVPRRLLDSLEQLAQIMPVVFASRTGAGELYTATYGFPGSEHDLLTRGLISAEALDGLKARLLLTLLLAAGSDTNALRDRFAEHTH
jgi:L-asparaginase